MAVGKGGVGELFPVEGITMASASAGIKQTDRHDVVLFALCKEAVTAGIYTLNSFCAAPVLICKKHTKLDTPQYFIINTGNANAGTGEKGLFSGVACCSQVAKIAGIKPEKVLPFSTGVIGEILPHEKIVRVIPKLFERLNNNTWLEAARGILTTDTRPKAFSKKVIMSGKNVTITGIAKGSGMIKPNMATMLAYIFTDAGISQSDLTLLLKQSADKSFNRITIDGDTSTNDCCMLVATGKSECKLSSTNNAQKDDWLSFKKALEEVFIELAQGLIKDGEGASKFINIKVEGGETSQECLQVAYTIAESPLVKTAIFASDPNWGRILAAVGRAGINNLNIDTVQIFLGDVCIVRNGSVSEEYEELNGQKIMDEAEIQIRIVLGRGSAFEEVWSSDLSYDYIKINAEYRT